MPPSLWSYQWWNNILYWCGKSDATLSSAILFQFNCALIILIYRIVMDLASLLFQEELGPDQLCQDIVRSNKIVLSWPLIFKSLFYGFLIVPAGSHSHEVASVNPHILVHRKLCINVPLYIYRFAFFKKLILCFILYWVSIVSFMIMLVGGVGSTKVVMALTDLKYTLATL